MIVGGAGATRRRTCPDTVGRVFLVAAARGSGPSTASYTTTAERTLAASLHAAPAADFLEGRALVHWGLDRSGLRCCRGASLLRDVGGAPVWSCALDKAAATGDPAHGVVSVTHSRSAVVVAIAGVGGPNALGVDVQEVERPPDGLVRRCAHRADVERYVALPEIELAHAFTGLWTVLEACAKARRSGLSAVLGRVRMVPGQPQGTWRGVTWTSTAPEPGLRLALATRPAVRDLRLHRLVVPPDRPSDPTQTYDLQELM